MLPPKTQELILSLKEQNVAIRDMVRLLKVSRNTIRRVLRQNKVLYCQKGMKTPAIEPLLPALFERCQGNTVRVQEILACEHNLEVAYSTITRRVREQQLRAQKRLVGEYYFEPGLEMQHDTSPHKIMIDDKKITLQCASLVLAYSRKIFIKYYARFTRFEAKLFLTEAIGFMGGACKRCIVDNTSVILASGSGSNAVIAPEMASLLQFFGSEFIAHAVGHADRKAVVERAFFYVERNFLPGRTFKSLEDLNQQALKWCCEVANQKVKRSLGMTPDAAYIQEKPYLLALPSVIPPVYALHHRLVDSHGYINLENNRYSVPQTLIGKQMDIYKYENRIQIYHQHKCIAEHPRLMGQGQKSKLPGHHENLYSRSNRSQACSAEVQLRDQHELLNQYIDQIKKRTRGRGQHALQKLLNLKRTYPKDAFYKAIAQAMHYGLYDILRLEHIILKYIAGEFFNLGDHHENKT